MGGTWISRRVHGHRSRRPMRTRRWATRIRVVCVGERSEQGWASAYWAPSAWPGSPCRHPAILSPCWKPVRAPVRRAEPTNSASSSRRSRPLPRPSPGAAVATSSRRIPPRICGTSCSRTVPSTPTPPTSRRSSAPRRSTPPPSAVRTTSLPSCTRRRARRSRGPLPQTSPARRTTSSSRGPALPLRAAPARLAPRARRRRRAVRRRRTAARAPRRAPRPPRRAARPAATR